MKRYEPKVIEPKWQAWWDEQKTYHADLNSDKPKYFGMSMFNYPSGAGIHIGHAMNYTISDVMARFKRQQGYESYHPVGWDSFGLPAENYAIKAGVSPQDSMATIIPSYHKQYRAMGWSNDWSKEIATHTPEYYKWTQWIFSEMFRAGLAYQDARQQWWCDTCQTVLANEQVLDDKCWRHDSVDDPEVTKREIKQWFFRITDYADELLEATDDLNWTESVKLAQKNWIGKSKGAEITFKVEGSSEEITVFTTRPDTIYGATFLALAPEHELVNTLTVDSQAQAVKDYQKSAAKKDEVERQASKVKTGVFTGAYAVNPINDQKIPIWVADYVLVGYGTGAIMAVPAHDERDHDFATAYGIPTVQVVAARFIDHSSPHQEGKELVPRNLVTCIVRHPEEEKYIVARPAKGVNWSPLMGGIDEAELPVDAARRELIEETGYYDIKTIEARGDVFVSEFFAMHKDVNRIAYCQTVYIELGSLDKKLELATEKDEQETKWVTREEYFAFPPTGGMTEVFEIAHNQRNDMAFEGRLVNSSEFSGQTTDEAREKIVADLAKKGCAREKTIFKIRDWSVTRQRYWGAPTPIIHCPDHGAVLVPDEQLPVLLPELEDFQPSGLGFLPDVVQAWEKEAMRAADCGVRVVCLRTGIVLGHEGGALQKMKAVTAT
jgi:leucyl-tRNA synthetase